MGNGKPERAAKSIVGCFVLVLIVGVCGGTIGWGISSLWTRGGSSNEQVPSAEVPKSKSDVDGSLGKPKQNLDFTGLRGVLSGKWEKKADRSDSHSLEFTEKSIDERTRWSHHIGKYETKGELLTVTDRHGRVNIYGLEFLSDGEIALRPENVKYGDFNDLAGQWQRTSLPAGQDAAVVGTGPIADAKRQVQRIEQKLAKIEAILERTLAERDELATKLRALGVNSTADLKGNIRARRLAENAVKLATEIDGLERQLASLDTELLNSRSIVRRMEREQAGLSVEEMRKLAQQLREAEDRTDGISAMPTTPLDVEAAVEKALKAIPKTSGPKKTK